MNTSIKTAVRHLTAGDVTVTGDTVATVALAYIPGTRRQKSTHRNVSLVNRDGKQRWVQWNASTQVYVTR